LDANFFDDDKVLAAGEAATYLFLAMMTKAKQLDTDGVLSRLQIERLGIRAWQKRLDALVAVNLVEPTTPGVYGITGWLNWNESREDRAERLRQERQRKANKGGNS
jgi:hypothetical protein